MVTFSDVFSGKRVWLTGHTGFKGAWLSQWLLKLGAIVHGYALAPDTTPALFDQLGVAGRLEHEIADIRDAESVKKSIRVFQPDFVFHMAAQSLVRRSYAIPVETYETNVNGTIHVLEALRGLENSCAAVIVTTDKCYENHESGRAYEEDDPLGGHDPYSSSKAMAEIATAAYRKSFFQHHPVCIASARAGNVIGGGDWAENRIVPDAMRALNRHEPISVRNHKAVRPWQHVLEPLSGYLMLAAAMKKYPENTILHSSFNFGPGTGSNRTVEDLVVGILKHRGGNWNHTQIADAVHEAMLLDLSIEKAGKVLGWHPKWNFDETIRKTTEWYQEVYAGNVTAGIMTDRQIQEYSTNDSPTNA